MRDKPFWEVKPVMTHFVINIPTLKGFIESNSRKLPDLNRYDIRIYIPILAYAYLNSSWNASRYKIFTKLPLFTKYLLIVMFLITSEMTRGSLYGWWTHLTSASMNFYLSCMGKNLLIKKMMEIWKNGLICYPKISYPRSRVNWVLKT